MPGWRGEGLHVSRNATPPIATSRSKIDSAAGWTVVFSAALATFAVFGVAYSFGVVLDEIKAEFGIGTGLTSLLFSISTFIYFVLGVFTGRLGDRYGPRRVLLAGAVSLGAGLWVTSLAGNLWLGIATYGFGVGFGVACAYVPMVSAVGGWFERHRTSALGVAVAGIGLGQMVGAQFVEKLIARYGWRGTFQVLAVVATGLLVVAAVGARRPPSVATPGEMPSMRRLMHNRRFALLYLSMLLLSASLFIPIIFIKKYVDDGGGTRGALLISIIGLASLLGRLGLGALGTVLPLMRLYQISYLVMGLSYLIWLFADNNYTVLVVFALVMGSSYGGFIALSPAIAAQLFGLNGLGSVLGALYTAAGVGGLAGPPLAGLLIDSYGFSAAIVAAMCTALASVPLLVATARAPAVPLATVGGAGAAPAPQTPTVAVPHDNATPASSIREPLMSLATIGPSRIDSVLLLSFGGPDGPDDVMPFLHNVTRGRDVPSERLADVARQYMRHGGVSPINAQNSELLNALSAELGRRGHEIPCYWGNRNWHPYLRDTVRQMALEDRNHAAVVTTSAFSSYSSCRQYNEDLAYAAAGTTRAPRLTRVRVYGNHPGFVGATAQRIREAIDGARLGPDVHTLFTAHSLPLSMAAACDYQAQLVDAAENVADLAGLGGPVEVVYQSRSGPPHVPWLEPDINDRLVELAGQGSRSVLVMPLGFVSDHMEVIVDLDTRARATASLAGLTMVRAATVGTHPLFVAALADLVEEASGLRDDRPTLGELGPRPDVCAADCCPARARAPGPSSAVTARVAMPSRAIS